MPWSSQVLPFAYSDNPRIDIRINTTGQILGMHHPVSPIISWDRPILSLPILLHWSPVLSSLAPEPCYDTTHNKMSLTPVGSLLIHTANYWELPNTE